MSFISRPLPATTPKELSRGVSAGMLIYSSAIARKLDPRKGSKGHYNIAHKVLRKTKISYTGQTFKIKLTTSYYEHNAIFQATVKTLFRKFVL